MPIPHLPHKPKQQSWRSQPQGSRPHHSASQSPKKSSGSTRWKRFLHYSWPKRLFLIAAVIFVLGTLFTISVFAWFSKDLPDPNKLIDRSLAESTKIYARDGTTLLYEIHGDQRRTVVPLEDIPMHVRNATIVAEDQGFYGHRGFSIKGILRAFFVNLLQGGSVQGGSTITQQFVKNSILTSEKTYTRKIKELVLSYQLENKFTKDQILQLYLNEIPYGSTAYGVESGSWIYFGKSVKEVNLAEAAILAALPKAPSALSPFGGNTERLFSRQQFILNSMADAGVISKEEADAAKNQEIAFQSRIENIIAPHFVFFVRELLSEKYSEKNVEQGGLKVITSLDAEKQKFAEEAVAKQVEKNATQYQASNAALVSIDTKTGQILAMVGSKDYFNDDIDGKVNVTIRPRQPGSSFKPIVYLTAFQRGYTPDTVVFDLETDFSTDSKPYHPRNYNLAEHGPLTLRKALAGSLNIPAVKTLYLAGTNNVLDVADLLGYTTLQDRSRYGLSLVLGGGEVTLLEHTNAFAALSREGVRHPIASILRVEDRNGKVLEQFQESQERVVKAEEVRQLTSILSDNEARTYIFGASNHLTLGDRPVAAKTGTTNDYRDAWTLGYTPSIATGVWVGNNDNSEMKRGADGSVIAAPIWNAYMRLALTGTPVETFKAPKPIEVEKGVLKNEFVNTFTAEVDVATGLVIPETCKDQFPEKYRTTKDFKEVHEILHYVAKEDPRGPAPTDPTADPQYAMWEKPVQRWAEANGYSSNTPNQAECDLRNPDLDPELAIQRPQSGEQMTSDTFGVDFTVKAASGRRIELTEAFIDRNRVSTDAERPWEVLYTPTNLTSGNHTLALLAKDSKGSFTQIEVPFFFINTSTARPFIVNPSNEQTLALTAFPFSGSFFVSDPGSVVSLDVVERLSGAERVIQNFSSLKSENGSFEWSVTEVGNYELFLRYQRKSKKTSTSEVENITVTSP